MSPHTHRRSDEATIEGIVADANGRQPRRGRYYVVKQQIVPRPVYVLTEKGREALQQYRSEEHKYR